MADDVTIAVVGGNAVVASDDVGGKQYQLVKLVWGPLDTVNLADTASGKPIPIQVRTSTGAEVTFGAESNTAAAVPARASYTGVNISGNLTGQTGIATGATHKAAVVALVDASGNQITTVADGSATGSAVPASAVYSGINVGGTLRGATALGVGSHYAQAIAIVDASGNQITTFGGTAGTVSTHHRITTASTNAVNIKASAGVLRAVRIFNKAAAPIYVKFHNTAGTPTAGSGVVYTVACQAGLRADVVIAGGGRSFATGIGMTVVTGLDDSDATAVALNDAIIEVEFE